MPASHVQIAPDSTGKDVDADSLTSSESGTPTVYRQVMVLGDPSTYGAKAAIANGGVQTRPVPSTTGTITSVGASVSTVTVLASNASRLGATIYNDSSAILYLALAASASPTVYTIQVPTQGYYELPNNGIVYTGILTGVWSSATGSARVTEFS